LEDTCTILVKYCPCCTKAKYYLWERHPPTNALLESTVLPFPCGSSTALQHCLQAQTQNPGKAAQQLTIFKAEGPFATHLLQARCQVFLCLRQTVHQELGKCLSEKGGKDANHQLIILSSHYLSPPQKVPHSFQSLSIKLLGCTWSWKSETEGKSSWDKWRTQVLSASQGKKKEFLPFISWQLPAASIETKLSNLSCSRMSFRTVLPVLLLVFFVQLGAICLLQLQTLPSPALGI